MAIAQSLKHLTSVHNIEGSMGLVLSVAAPFMLVWEIVVPDLLDLEVGFLFSRDSLSLPIIKKFELHFGLDGWPSSTNLFKL